MKDNEFYSPKSEYDSPSKRMPSRTSPKKEKLIRHVRRRKMLGFFATAAMIIVVATASDLGTVGGKENTGYIRDAKTGEGLSNVLLEFRKGEQAVSGTVVRSTTTDDGGRFTVSLPEGSYTAHAWKNGYLPEDISFVIDGEENEELIGTLLPVRLGDVYTIVLTWGETPYDLDSHVETDIEEAEDYMHVYYGEYYCEREEKEVCLLDVDDTTSYGPETITLDPYTEDAYYYYVHNFSMDDEIQNSRAVVKLYKGSTLLDTYTVPEGGPEGLYWNVFAVKDGKIKEKNTITEFPDTTYAE